MWRTRSRRRRIFASRRSSSRWPGTVAVSWAALITSCAALVLSASGLAGAAASRSSGRHGTTRPAHGSSRPVVHLGANGLIPARLVPKPAFAQNANELGGRTLAEIEAATQASCPGNTTDLGTWCLMTQPYTVPAGQIGDNNYFYATQACVALGGYLPTAAQLIGAANKVPLESVITDNPATATIETDPTTGLQDQREMTATLVTVSAGSSAAGSEGVSVGSTGNPNEGQPDPTPEPADPDPETLQYVTVYDNFQKGGFAGSEPVAQPENFRCAFEKVPGGSLKSIQ